MLPLFERNANNRYNSMVSKESWDFSSEDGLRHQHFILNRERTMDVLTIC